MKDKASKSNGKTKGEASGRGRQPVHKCVVAGALLKDSQVGAFSMAAVKNMTGRQLYTVIADRVTNNIKDGNRVPARNIAYKAKLRIVKALAAKGVVLAG